MHSAHAMKFGGFKLIVACVQFRICSEVCFEVVGVDSGPILGSSMLRSTADVPFFRSARKIGEPGAKYTG